MRFVVIVFLVMIILFPVSQVWECARENNGIMALLQLIQTKTPLTDADEIRALACRALVLILYPVSVFDSNSGGAGRACQVIHRHADHVQALDFQQRGKF